MFYIYPKPIKYLTRNNIMFEEFTNQILLTPTIYSILKEDAKLNRTSARVRLDIILREVYSKQLIDREENEDEGLFK